MLLVPDEGFPDLLRKCEREALHLEVLDSYAKHDDTVVFSASGAWSGAVTTDPHIAAFCGGLRDRSWPLGIPFEEYVHR